MEGTIYSLIPPVLMLILVLFTRKVLLSLGVGVIAGALMLHEFHLVDTLVEIWTVFSNIFISDGALNLGSFYLLGFLILLGMTTAFMTASGGSRAFGEWAIEKVKTRRGAQLMPALSGLVIFIDDYFNSLAVGQVSRPLTDRHRISRAKLAYFIDSTSAPVTVISPISSWGAYIIGTLGVILADNKVTDYASLEAFLYMIPLNFYAFAAILLVFLTAWFNLDIGPMKKHEQRAVKTGKLVDPDRGDVPGDLDDAFDSHPKGKIHHLLLPLIALIVGTVAAMITTGIRGTEGQADILDIFANTSVNISLFIGGLLAVIVALLLFLIQSGKKASTSKVLWEGTKAMLPAIYILVLAWMIGAIIDGIGTGEYLAGLVEEASIDSAFLPLIIFLVAGLMALATGTSWGTFGIMLPIAAEITAVIDVNLVLPSLAAVLAGSVFGDHCSPISDTTILSSTGAGANHIDHVLTQLPYACIGAVAAAAGYVLIGLTGQVMLSLVVSLVIVLVVVLLIHSYSTRNKKA